ncbi:hypothetical protein DKX38_010698 [Salix brachista]|uniref:Ribosomal protein L39e n=1 Tax=Salix brachista TaxID=2182728 RepID=A0A5N5ME93_9ROSI|nr:hypothetical protein DKX38_010698 [Salix brachista]
MPSHKTFRIKKKLAKKMRQNRPIPHWIRMRTDNTISFDESCKFLDVDFCQCSCIGWNCFAELILFVGMHFEYVSLIVLQGSGFLGDFAGPDEL